MRFDPVATYARSNPDRLAVMDLADGRTWSYLELASAVDRLAAWLVSELGANSGARTATLSKNCAEMAILQYAAVRAGCIFVPFNWRLASAEIEALATDAEPAIVFAQEGFEAPSGARRQLAIGEMLSLGEAGSAPPPTRGDRSRMFPAFCTLRVPAAAPRG